MPPKPTFPSKKHFKSETLWCGDFNTCGVSGCQKVQLFVWGTWMPNLPNKSTPWVPHFRFLRDYRHQKNTRRADFRPQRNVCFAKNQVDWNNAQKTLQSQHFLGDPGSLNRLLPQQAKTPSILAYLEDVRYSWYKRSFTHSIGGNFVYLPIHTTWPNTPLED